MLPIILLVGVGAAVWHHKHKGAARLTPQRAAVHSQLMGRVYDPKKLDHAAELFKREGLHTQARDLTGKAKQIRLQAKGAAALCEGARAADQNAMGMIAAIRENAAKGDPRALVSHNLILKYCQLHPPKDLGPMGETPMLPEHDPAPGWVAARAG